MKYGRVLLEDVEGYVPGEQPQTADIIKLNTNENPYPPSPRVIEALQSVSVNALRRYPDPVSLNFRAACARRYGLPNADWVIAGNGMDEVLAMAVRTFVDPDDAILTTYPTYTLYETLAQLHGAHIVEVDLDENFQLPEAFFETPARLVFLTRPNAPTGVAVPKGAVERLCESFDGIVFLDEAYVDFADAHCLDLVQQYDNLIVGRSFSKSYSLAGMRLGIGVAQPAIIDEFLKTKDSYNMNAVAQRVGKAAIEDAATLEANTARIRATRGRVTNALTELGFEVPESQANFLFAQWKGSPSAKTLFESLRDRGIFVRYFNARRLDHALRISIGTDAEMDALLTALGEMIAPVRA